MTPIEGEIRRFLKDENPEVLCVRGKWGVGKTFAWKRFLRNALNEYSVAKDQYSYVSLFGVGSIPELRRAIFENIVSLKLAESPSATTIGRTLGNWQKLTRKAFGGTVQSLPVIRNASEALANAAFMMVNDQIVCLDDLERIGAGLRTKDVLGMVSYLKEERCCKIVLLLNEEQMDAAAKKEFSEQVEKVVDTNLEFSPSPAEAVEIGLSDKVSFREELKNIVIILSISNIRTIKRVERLTSQCLDIVTGLHDNVRLQVVQTVALAAWAKLQPNDAPPLEYIRRFNAYTAAFEEHAEGQVPDPQKKAWNLSLDKLNYTNSDDLDLALIDGVDAGYFDSARIRELGEAVDADHAQSARGSAFSRAWRLYHDSFKDNDDAVLDAMFEAVKEEPVAISPMNLNAAIGLFREMGRDAQASEMVKMYVEAHGDNRAFFDLSEYHFAGDVTDPELRQAFSDRYESIGDNRRPGDVLLECARQSGWNHDDVDLIGKLSVDELVALFEDLDGKDTTSIVKRALTIGEPSVSTGKLISENAAEALKIVAKKSRMNKRRVQGLGVKL